MNFEDLQKAWQSQNASARVTIDAGLLMKEVRRNQRQFRATIFWRDAREVGVAYLLTWYFIHSGLRTGAWATCLIGLACFGVGTFMVVDRLLQRRTQPAPGDLLVGCVQTSLHQVNHQIWLLKNVFWWYLLPIGAALGVFVGVGIWRLGHHASQLAAWCVYALSCILLYWFIYWLNQFAVKKNLEPRQRELEALLAETGNPVSPTKIKNKTMKTTVILTILLTAVLAVGVMLVAVSSPSTVPTARAAATSTPGRSLETIRERHDLPALAVVVLKNGEICDRGAVGVRKWGETEPVTTNDVFHVGACALPMTATLTAMLIEEGKLRWNTTIADVFPDLKGRIDEQYEAVTVEQLLQHRGGVPGPPPAAAWKRAQQENGTPAQQRLKFIEAVLAEPPAAPPGTRMIYSNQGYAIIGAMLETVTGQDYETLITEKLFKPLRMDTAGFGSPGTAGQVDQPWGHVRQGLKTIPLQVDNPPAVAPAACAHCSLDDLARFALFHLRHTSDGLLKSETLAKLHTPPPAVDVANPLENYTGGWVILQRGWAGGTTLWRNGSNTTWYIVMWLAPEKDFAVIAATNIAGPDAELGCDEAATAMILKWAK